MTKLTDTQMIVLSAAAQRDRLVALPLPSSLKGGAIQNVVAPLLQKGLLEELPARPSGADPVWREADGQSLTIVVTAAGLAAIGIVPDNVVSEAAATGADTKAETRPDVPVAPAPKERRSREGTKQALLIELLKRPAGATIDEIVTATGWQSHTARGAMAGALKKKLGLTITSEKDEASGRVYRII